MNNRICLLASLLAVGAAACGEDPDVLTHPNGPGGPGTGLEPLRPGPGGIAERPGLRELHEVLIYYLRKLSRGARISS